MIGITRLGLLFLASSLAAAEQERPNIVFILMEDMGTEIGAYGDPVAETPALDRLAAEGLLFERGARVTAASCAPSRGSLFTGLYPHQNGMLAFDETTGWHFREGCPTFVQILRKHGYYTGLTYKTGVSPEKSLSFDFKVRYWENKKEGEDTPHLTSNSIDNFEVFLDERPDGRPFYFQAQTPDTHSTWMDERKRAHIKGVPSGIPYSPPDKEKMRPLAQFGPDYVMSDGMRDAMWDYYCAVQRADYFVAGILRVLQCNGLAENTLVVFSADHGPSTLSRGKTYPYEFGLRVPFLVRWPGKTEPGSRTRALASFVDLMPTFLDAAGIEIPDYLPGRSLVPVFTGQASQGARRYVYSAYNSHTAEWKNFWPNRTICDSRYKLIHNLLGDGARQRGWPAASPSLFLTGAPEGSLAKKAFERAESPPPFELYDLAQDPGEIHNLSGDPGLSALEAELKETLLHWRTEIVGDPTVDPRYLKEFTEHNRIESEKWSAAPVKKQYKMNQERWITPWDPAGYGKDPAF
jgi:N-sulfoglucosamine sulfohydrolase